MTRRELLKYASLSTAALGLDACAPKMSTVKPATPAIPPPTPMETPTVSPVQKIQNAEFSTNGSMEINDSIEKAVISATVEYFCNRIGKPETAEAVKGKISVLPEDKFLKQHIKMLEDREGIELTSERKEKLKSALGLTKPDGTIILNRDNLTLQARILSDEPSNAQFLKGKNAYAITLKSTLIHELCHLSASREEITISPPHELNLRNPETGKAVKLQFSSMKEFIFYGTNLTENIPYVFDTGAEPVVEYTARILKAETGVYTGNDLYGKGADIISELNQASNITFEQFLQYFLGNKPLNDLFTVWDKTNNRANPMSRPGVISLLLLGYAINGNISFNQSLNLIKQQFAPR